MENIGNIQTDDETRYDIEKLLKKTEKYIKQGKPCKTMSLEVFIKQQKKMIEELKNGF